MDSELTEEPENIVSAAELLKVYASAVDEALARIAELKAALKPFADAAEHFMPDNNSDIFAAASGHKLYYSDLRGARDAYLGETNGT
jgi:hypothetical protein